ncbi:APC family permease [Nonomuraea rhodomycinica]|uniref:APC family permease n=2 Tax=Nonomuraea rhodomycinica TaxID=1712872 RepID=A0A7Y6IQZ3_9ACTN|nr:APC family permease [Nonomuraea rhodomycinica]
MIGAGVFAAFAPAAAAAGPWLLPALALAAVVAYCNATSSARLAALYPESGGTYVYGRRRLGPLWGYLAGWGFTVGKTASCAAMALTFGAYVAPAFARPLAVGAVVGVTVLNVYGVRRSTAAARVMVAFVLAVLAAVIATGLLATPAPTAGTPTAGTPTAGTPTAGTATAALGQTRHAVPGASAGMPGVSRGAVDDLGEGGPYPIPGLREHLPSVPAFVTVAEETGPSDTGLWGVLQGAGLLFFAFAGYARIATLGEEVRDPARAIPRAIGIALGITLVVYTLVAVAALRVLGWPLLAVSAAPLDDVVTAAGFGWLRPVVTAGAAVAALGALLALVLGVSRTVLAMARERDLPHALSAVHPARREPRRAELAVGVAVVALLLVADLRGAIGFSSFGVLVYYAIANAAALTLTREEGAPPRVVPVAGVVLCLVLAATLPWASVVGGLAVFAVGALVWAVVHRRRPARP